MHHFKAIGEFKLELQSGNAQFGSKLMIFCLCDLEIWWMTLKIDRTPLLYYAKLCASFQSHQWIQTGVTVRKWSIRVTIGDFLSHVSWKFNGWPWKTKGYLFYATSCFVHHFVALVNSNWSYSPETPNLGQNRQFFVLCDFEISQVTLKINRAPLLCYFKLCA